MIKSGVFRTVFLKAGILFRYLNGGANFHMHFPRLAFESTGPDITIVLGYREVKQAGLGVAPGKGKVHWSI